MAGNYNFICDQGATFSSVMTYYSDEAQTTPVNLTGFTARMTVRRKYEDQNSIISLTTENARIALGGALGTITLTISATDSASLPIGSWYYDLELVNGSAVTRLIGGSFEVIGEVTR
jgi:hypothetical protein